MLRSATLHVALLALAGPLLAQEPPYPDAWAPATVAAAEAAAARLTPTSLAIRGRELAIPGLSVGLGAGGTGIVASVQQLAAAKQDLGAEETALEIRVELPADVLFDFDRADIRADAASALANLATIVAAYPQGRVDLSGHTDDKGSDAYNLTLSQRRASAVKEWLVARHGVDGGRLYARGEGESRPVADNATETGRQRNRRVEALIHKQ